MCEEFYLIFFLSANFDLKTILRIYTDSYAIAIYRILTTASFFLNLVKEDRKEGDRAKISLFKVKCDNKEFTASKR